MSSYLTFYLVPNKTRLGHDSEGGSKEIKISEGLPLNVISYSRGTDIYQYFINNLSIAYCGNDEDNYSDITKKDFDVVLKALGNAIKDLNYRLEVQYKIVKNVSSEAIHEIAGEISYLEEDLKDLKETKSMVLNLKDFIFEAIDFGDFEKCVANID